MLSRPDGTAAKDFNTANMIISLIFAVVSGYLYADYIPNMFLRGITTWLINTLINFYSIFTVLILGIF